MTARHIVTDTTVGLALLVIALSSFGALRLRDNLARLHYLTPVTSVAVPLFVAGLVVDTGWGITAGLDILIGAVVMVTGPLLQIEIGRIEAQQRRLISDESPP